MTPTMYYYIDDSALLQDDLYRAIEGLVSTGAQCCFLLDTAVQSRIADYRALGREREALTLENLVNLFAALGNAMELDTKGGFDLSVLSPMASSLTVITQRPYFASALAQLGEGVQLLSCENGELCTMEISTDENKKAFYLGKDSYVTPIDIEDINYVFSPRYGYLKLDKSRDYSGGEGACYRTYNGLFCKIYFKKHQTYVNCKKLQAMVEMGCDNPYISWPLDILYAKNQFVGYLMHELVDTRSVDTLRDENFSGFSLLDRFVIVRNFLRDVAYLHSRGILVGDMKLDNILVGANKDVYIIDAGSFQLQDFACDVCHKEYTERIYTGDQLKRILRSEREEYFPINKIIFEMLMLKGPFYSRDNTEIDGDGSRNFTYPMDFASLGTDPRSLPYHLKVWFSLSPAMRQYFHAYFTEGRVTELSDWLRELDVYILQKSNAQRPKQ